MSEEIIVKHCSPTILGIKTGNIFTCRFESKKDEHEYLKSMNLRLSSKGLRVLPLRQHNGGTLIYVYRPSRLKKDLRDKTAKRILSERGYCCKSTDRCVAHLVRRIRECSSFPHEIGLFLGYPPEDVCGFIEHKDEGCKCVGCWKVYGDAEKAMRLFDKYRRCTDLCCSLLSKGCKLERLAAGF